MESNSVKIEVPAKPLLSPTRSVDEGFESDPDRVSTDESEVQLGNTQQFDILQRTDRDGVTHTQITRRSQSPSPTSIANAAKISLVCVSGDSGGNSSSNSDSGSGNGTGSSSEPSKSRSHNHELVNQVGPPQKPERTRRSKTKAPQPPSNSRSHSVDSIRFATNGGDLVIREIATDTINGDVLSGKFVRVQVDPNQSCSSYYPTTQRMHKSSCSSLYSIYPNSGSSSLQLWPASSPSYQKVVSISKPKQYQQQQQQQSFRPSSMCNAISSRHHVNRISHPVPVCWTQSIPRQTRR